MSAPAAATDFYVREEEHHAPGGSTHLGFWIYLMSDCLIFAVLFATYGVLGTSLAGGPGPRLELAQKPCACCSVRRSPIQNRAHRAAPRPAAGAASSSSIQP